jgi:peptidoglycan/xylan/chitin deacetylase (PgdA/CDA1 family)
MELQKKQVDDKMNRQLTIANKNSIFPLSMILLISIGAFGSCNLPETRNSKSPIVIRIDDVQDFAYRDVQLLLLEYSIKNDIPLSLAAIPSALGSDMLLLNALKSAVHSGSEVTAHGWEHEDLTTLTERQQENALQESKSHLQELFAVNLTVLVPPLFKYNEDTLTAMRATNYSVVSGLSEFHKIGLLPPGVMSVPATVEVSDYENGVWIMKTLDQLLKGVHESLTANGYAVVVTHPQEFIRHDRIDPEIVATYYRLLRDLEAESYFTSLHQVAALFQR